MSIKDYKIDYDVYWIAHDGANQFNYDKSASGCVVTSCLPYFETFSTHEEMVERLGFLGVVIPDDTYPS